MQLKEGNLEVITRLELDWQAAMPAHRFLVRAETDFRVVFLITVPPEYGDSFQFCLLFASRIVGQLLANCGRGRCVPGSHVPGL